MKKKLGMKETSQCGSFKETKKLIKKKLSRNSQGIVLTRQRL